MRSAPRSLSLAGVVLAACASTPPGPAGPSRAPAVAPPAPPAPPSSPVAAAAPSPPGPADRYAALVARAEAGDETVDFLALRMAYLESPAYAQGRAAHDHVLDLRQKMFGAMRADDAATVLATARETLKLIYVDLEAQKARYQACAILKDQACADQGKRVEMGLLKALVSTGNGHSCGSAWQVVTIDEEYFILHMLGLKLRTQSLVTKQGHECDEMAVTDEKGKRKTYFFDVGDMLSAQQKLIDAAAR